MPSDRHSKLTFDDIFLTFHAMHLRIRSSAIRGYASLVSQLGGDPKSLLAQHNLPTSISDESLHLSAPAVARLLEESAHQLGCPDFGLQLAHYQDISILGPLAVAMQHSETVGDALEVGTRYLALHSAATKFTLVGGNSESQATHEFRYELGPSNLPSLIQSYDLGLSVAHRVLKLAICRDFQLVRVHLPHAALAPRARYISHFGAPVDFNKRNAALLFPSSVLKLRCNRSDEAIKAVALHFLKDHADCNSSSISLEVRAAISNALGLSRSRLTDIARAMHVHPRQMQRLLDREGTSFDEVRNQVVKQTTMRYLSSTQIPLGQVAELVGLSTQSALTRSCRRWFGQTPSSIRKNAG